MRVAVDSSVLVALINPRDLWRQNAVALRAALLAREAELVHFDCVAAHVISAAT